MKAKEDKICEAYGKTYNQLKGNIDCDGWCLNKSFAPNTDFLDLIDLENIERQVKSDIQGNLIFRPKSLQGIENNNGWIQFERKPFDSNNYWVFTDKGNIYTLDKYTSFFSINCLEKITHYQPITIPEKPLY